MGTARIRNVPSAAAAEDGHALTADGQGNTDWEAVSASSIEGTAVLSTGETGGTKFLREDGDGTCSWQVGGGGASQLSDLSDVGTVGYTNRHALMADGVNFDSRALVEADISDLGSYLTSESNDLTASVTWANIPDANVPQSAVTQHQAALTLSESQIESALASAAAFTVNNYVFDTDQTLGAVQDGWVLTFDNGTGEASFAAVVGGSGDSWGDPVDASIVPDTDATYNIGSNLSRFLNGYFDDVAITNDLVVGGLVDGVDIAARDHDAVTVAGTNTYLTLSGQVLTRGDVDLANHVTGNLPVSNLNSGTGADATTFWRGDGSWATPAGGGGGGADLVGVFRASGSDTLGATPVTVTLNTEDADPDANYSIASGAVTTTSGGWFMINANLPIDEVSTSGGARGNIVAYIERDQTTGTWLAINSLRNKVYTREASGGTGIHIGGLIQLSANEAVRIRIADDQGNVDNTTLAQFCSLHMVRLTT